jgi:hypothetical protein
MISGMVPYDPDGSPRWRYVAATMAHVSCAYRRLPAPVKAVIWLVPAALARVLGLPDPPWW